MDNRPILRIPPERRARTLAYHEAIRTQAALITHLDRTVAAIRKVLDTTVLGREERRHLVRIHDEALATLKAVREEPTCAPPSQL